MSRSNASTLMKVLTAALALAASGARADGEAGVVKVFILAGQSNMEGLGHVRTLGRLGEAGQFPQMLRKIRRGDGSWVVRRDVFVYFHGGKSVGPLTVGFGADKDRMGPELMFGAVMGDALKDPVLLIKTAWGGKDLHFDFRPPSAGDLPYPIDPQALADRGGESGVGACYRRMVADIRDCIDHLDTYFPDLAGRRCEIAGLVWFQGWNEMFPSKGCPFDQIMADYPALYSAMVGDLEKEFGLARLPSVVGEMGVNGERATGRSVELRKAQASIADLPELRGKVRFVRTAPFWDTRLDELQEEEQAIAKRLRLELRDTVAARIRATLEARAPGERDAVLDEAVGQAVRQTPEYRAWQARWDRIASHWECHYFGSAPIYCRIGSGLAEAMRELLGPAARGRRVGTRTGR